MAPRGPSAYMLFANEQRAAVQAELAAATDSGKVGAAVVGKELGARWNALDEAQKHCYKELAAAKAAELMGEGHVAERLRGAAAAVA